ncbi:MAG TPA: hypothetical protein VNB03_14635 [Casimicrobiaceae bacterium]|jgi:predicted lipoprotein with Yx(FWY)xxD motif|nr:hypothetical protein [Casimicrobiaceae bacterium]
MNARNTLNATALTALPLVVGLVLAFVVSYASAQATAEKNGVLTDAEGRTLYTFDPDTAVSSRCNGGCAAAWPPFATAEGAKPASGYSIVVRNDGGRQWAIDGKPLYRFAGDTKPGDVLGDGHGGAWHVVKRGTQKASTSVNFTGYAY